MDGPVIISYIASTGRGPNVAEYSTMDGPVIIASMGDQMWQSTMHLMNGLYSYYTGVLTSDWLMANVCPV